MAKKEAKRTTSELIMDMRGILDAAETEARRLDEDGVKVAASRVRKGMQEIKRLAKIVRDTALEKQKELRG